MELLLPKSIALLLILRCLFLLLLTKINISKFLISQRVSRYISCKHHYETYIRLGQCTHSMLAHLDGVTSLSIDATGFSLVSGSHDCSVRFWDLFGSRSCVQELTTHREKAREGVLDVQFHPTLPFMASGGADGVVKLYASS